MTEQRFRRVRGIFFSIALSLSFFPGLALTRDSMENTQTRLSSSGSTASQAGEGLAAQWLMAGVSKM